MAEEQVTILLDNGTSITPVGFTGEMSVEFITKAMDLGDDKQEKIIEGLIFEIEAEDVSWLLNVEFHIGLADRLKDEPAWYGAYTLSSLDSPVWLEQSIPAARYVYLKFHDHQVVGIWALSAVELLGYKDGGRM